MVKSKNLKNQRQKPPIIIIIIIIIFDGIPNIIYFGGYPTLARLFLFFWKFFSPPRIGLSYMIFLYRSEDFIKFLKEIFLKLPWGGDQKH